MMNTADAATRAAIPAATPAVTFATTRAAAFDAPTTDLTNARFAAATETVHILILCQLYRRLLVKGRKITPVSILGRKCT